VVKKAKEINTILKSITKLKPIMTSEQKQELFTFFIKKYNPIVVNYILESIDDQKFLKENFESLFEELKERRPRKSNCVKKVCKPLFDKIDDEKWKEKFANELSSFY
jgi:ribosomal protein L5